MSDQPANRDAPERKAVLLICLLAAIHVFVFSATFPFFNVVDEEAHIDLAVHYSHGDIPRKIDFFCAETRPYLVVYYSPEYLWPPGPAPGHPAWPHPAWKQPLEKVRQDLLNLETYYRAVGKNVEATQPPLYYMLAGAWWRVGKLLEMDGLELLYWLRFFNVLLIMILAWLGWFTAGKIFPKNKFIRLGVAALIAFMPQTAFYSVNSDILSPLAFGTTFLLLLKFGEAATPTPRLAAAIGLALAATYLTKLSNLPLLGAAGGLLAFKILKLAQGGKLRASASSLGILAACMMLPTLAWMIWCRLNFGDFTGSGPKIQMMGWTPQPLAEWFQHPIFTLHGLWFFVSQNISTFWQGELLWHGQPMAIASISWFYVSLTFAVLLFTLAGALKPPVPLSDTQRTAIWFGFASMVSALIFFAWLSVKFDFQHCFYPSRIHPFFVSGRLMLGLLIPFLVMFAYGLDCALRRFRPAVKFIVLAALLAFMLGSEITTDWGIFPNEFNWFHN